MKFYSSISFFLLLFLPVNLLLAQTEKRFTQDDIDKIHKEIISIDTHNDTEMKLLRPRYVNGVLVEPQVTFAKMKKGGLDAAFFACFLDQKRNDKTSLDSVYRHCKQELTNFKKYVREHSDEAAIAYSPADVVTIKKSGKSCVILAIENGYGIGDKVERVDEFFNMGVRYITLCHNLNNLICDASMEKVPSSNFGGVTPFGRKVIERMNSLGMIIDVSHSASSSLRDILKYSKSPVIATHSGVWEIKHHNRNLKDSEIKAIAAAGGLIQVATGRFFLSDMPKSQVNIKTLADHIDYVKNLVGIEHVGIGTDFDGGGGVVGLEDVSKMKDITAELLRRGYSKEDLKLFWGGNLLRVWQTILDKAKN